LSVDIATMPGVLSVTLNRHFGSPGAISVLLSTKGDTVIHTILFDFNRDSGYQPATLADVYGLLGPPLYLSVYNKYFMTLEYGDDQNGILVMAKPETRLRFLQYVDTVVLYGKGREEISYRLQSQQREWRGFTTLEKYGCRPNGLFGIPRC